MNLLRKLLGFAPRDRLLLARVLLLLGIVRVSLKVLPFRLWRPFLARIERLEERQKVNKVFSIYKIVWAISFVSPYIPGVKCLARAITAQILLRQEGYPTQMKIGVAKNEKGEFLAHAWVENKGRTVIGGLGNINRSYRVMPLTNVDNAYKLEWTSQ